MDQTLTMPVLRPVRIPTKDQRWYRRVWTWFLSTRQWEVVEDYFLLYSGYLLMIPKGFIFDGASIPRIFWWFLSPTGLLLIPSLFHAYGYRYNYLWEVVDGEPVKWMENVGKSFWDKLFLEVSEKVNGVHVASYAAYASVAVGGWFAWHDHREEKLSEI